MAMRLPSAGFSITIRVSTIADPYAMGRLATAVGEAGGVVTALDVVDSDHVNLVADITCDTADSAHATQVTKALDDLDGVEVRKVSDRTFLLPCSNASAASTRGRSCSTRRTPTRSCRSCGPSPRRTAASTWRTSQHRAASRSRPGCATCSTSRSSTTISTAPPSACWPPSPTRCGSSARSSPMSRSSSAVPARPARRSSNCCCARAWATSSRTTGRAPCTAGCPTWPARGSGWPTTPTATPTRATCPARCAVPTCSSGCPRPTCSPARTSPRWRRVRSCSRWPTRTPRLTPGRHGRTRPSSPPDAPTSPTRSTTCWRSPAFSGAMLDAGATAFTEEMALAAARAIADAVGADKINPSVIVPSVFDPKVVPAVADAVRAVARA